MEEARPGRGTFKILVRWTCSCWEWAGISEQLQQPQDLRGIWLAKDALEYSGSCFDLEVQSTILAWR